MDTTQGVLLTALHHQFDRFGEAFILLLHLRQHTDTVLQVAHLQGETHGLLLGLGGTLLAALHLEGIAFDHIADALCLLGGIHQGAAVGAALGLSGSQLLTKGGQFLLRTQRALLPLTDTGAEGGQLCSSIGSGGAEQGFFCAEGVHRALSTGSALAQGACLL